MPIDHNKTCILTDAEMVIRKKQIMCDKEFPQDYPITVYKFTQDVSTVKQSNQSTVNQYSKCLFLHGRNSSTQYSTHTD